MQLALFVERGERTAMGHRATIAAGAGAGLRWTAGPTAGPARATIGPQDVREQARKSATAIRENQQVTIGPEAADAGQVFQLPVASADYKRREWNRRRFEQDRRLQLTLRQCQREDEEARRLCREGSGVLDGTGVFGTVGGTDAFGVGAGMEDQAIGGNASGGFQKDQPEARESPENFWLCDEFGTSLLGVCAKRGWAMAARELLHMLAPKLDQESSFSLRYEAEHRGRGGSANAAGIPGAADEDVERYATASGNFKSFSGLKASIRVPDPNEQEFAVNTGGMFGGKNLLDQQAGTGGFLTARSTTLDTARSGTGGDPLNTARSQKSAVGFSTPHNWRSRTGMAAAAGTVDPTGLSPQQHAQISARGGGATQQALTPQQLQLQQIQMQHSQISQMRMQSQHQMVMLSQSNQISPSQRHHMEQVAQQQNQQLQVLEKEHQRLVQEQQQSHEIKLKFVPESVIDYVNRPNTLGWTPLLLACQGGDTNPAFLDIVELLLQYRANPDGPPSNTTRTTPLMLACSSGYLRTTQLLIHGGCNLWLRNVNKQSALELVLSKKLSIEQEQKFSRQLREGVDNSGSGSGQGLRGQNGQMPSMMNRLNNPAVHGEAINGPVDANGRRLDLYGMADRATACRQIANWEALEQTLKGVAAHLSRQERDLVLGNSNASSGGGHQSELGMGQFSGGGNNNTYGLNQTFGGGGMGVSAVSGMSTSGQFVGVRG